VQLIKEALCPKFEEQNKKVSKVKGKAKIEKQITKFKLKIAYVSTKEMAKQCEKDGREVKSGLHKILKCFL